MRLTKNEEALLHTDKELFLLSAYLSIKPEASVSECQLFINKGRRKTYEMLLKIGWKGNKKGNKKGNSAERASTENSTDLGNKKGNKKGNGILPKMIEVFSESYVALFNVPYSFSPIDIAKLKSIKSKLEGGMRSKGIEINEDSLLNSFKIFLSIIDDEWVLQHYSLKIIESKYNEIISNAKRRKSNTKEANRRDMQDLEASADAIISSCS